MNTAIILAAGKGTRFNSDRPKQFLEILGKPVIIHTLDRFEHSPAIDEIVLVLSSEDIDDFVRSADVSNIAKLKLIVIGGASRAESVRNGFEVVNIETEIVAVHDGARPLVTPGEIFCTVEMADKVGAACLVTGITDTVKSIKGDRITGTVDRTRLRRALTPQAFRYEILRETLLRSDLDSRITDECFLAEKAGFEVAFVEGNPRNIKITHPDDLKVAEMFLKEYV